MLCWAKFWLINYTVFETLPGPHWLRSESNPGCEQPNKVFFNKNVGYSENQKYLYLRKGKKQKNKQNTYGRHWISLRVLWPGQNCGKRLLLRHQFCYRPPVTLFEWGCCAVARPRPWCSAVTRVKWPTPPILCQVGIPGRTSTSRWRGILPRYYAANTSQEGWWKWHYLTSWPGQSLSLHHNIRSKGSPCIKRL